MKHPFRSLALTALAVTAAASFASAAPETLRIDPNHSIAGFAIRHLFAKVNGRFTDVDGRLTWDGAAPANSSVDVTIKAASITTQNDFRDKDLRSDNFFDVAKYPTLTFKSTKVELAEGKTTLAAGDAFKVYGDLTMKGITKPVVLAATFNGSGQVAIGGMKMGTVTGFEATTTINRKEWNILWNKNLDNGGTLLGDDVTINLEVEATTPRQSAEGARKVSPEDAKNETGAAVDKK